MKILCGYKFELYVDNPLRAALSRNAGCRRFVFNKALALQNERRKAGETLFTYSELAAELVQWKKAVETSFLKEAMSQPLQQALRDLDRAIRDSFRPKDDPARKEWPRFKAKDVGDGFRIPQFKPSDIDDANGRVKLPKIGARRVPSPFAMPTAPSRRAPSGRFTLTKTADVGSSSSRPSSRSNRR